MTYRALPEPLHETAETVRTRLEKDFGLSKVKIEEPLEEEIEWRPTLSGVTRDHHVICVEVTSGTYTDALDGFVLACMKRGIPAKLYIACPDTGDDKAAGKVLKTFERAREHGVGVMLVKKKTISELARPIELSLASVRPIDPNDLLKKHRQAIKDARDTFVSGDPVSGCARVFAEIEDLSRRFAEKCRERGWWTGLGKGNITTHAWNDLCKKWRDGMDYPTARTVCPNLTEQLISTLVGIAPKRNETGAHKPKTRAALIKRDKNLRTRFESCVDLFIELQDAARPLKL